MHKPVTVVVNEDDELCIQTVAKILRSGGVLSKQITDFINSFIDDQQIEGLRFQPYAGQILVCQFGLGFQRPEIVKTRPVIVVSPPPRFNSGLCTVVPISSKRPNNIEPYHYKLPVGLLPAKQYEEAWVKGDLIQTVGLHRLDRVKVGFRKYHSPVVPNDVLREVRRCVLHACGMHDLTQALQSAM